ncbi:hypothetical protein [Arvimicrobium flavum]|uniref:hypothetical protein n=1 Tax=Arvimicrobium flavum TaxID=3393320 RepID=UPI00237A7E85|nr:hypothetical protein [Mesorhizobium shangrilense]
MPTVPRGEPSPAETPVEQEEVENLPPGGVLRPTEHADVLPEEDDDNPYQDSDQALPDDAEEETISRNPGKEGGLFDEV